MHSPFSEQEKIIINIINSIKNPNKFKKSKIQMMKLNN